MTMTDTEAKALALVNDVEGGPVNRQLAFKRTSNSTAEALCRAIERLEATEARHAAELREQAERFSEALKRYYGDDGCPPHPILAPFILPKPDPLAEALETVVKAYIAEHGIEAFKALPFFGSIKNGDTHD